jgi:hypothetical protein
MNINDNRSNDSAVDLKSLAQTLTDLRKSVRANNPILKTVAASRLYPSLALVLGMLMGIYCMAIYMMPSLSGQGSSWILIAALLVAGGTVKLLLTNRIVGRLPNGGFMAVLRAIYGGKAGSFFASAALCILVGIFFILRSGHPWYIAPMISIFVSFAAHTLDFLIDLPEYKVMAWSSLVSGLTALFFIESAPWLWMAFIFIASFGLFGIVGLARSRKESGQELGA